MDGVDLHLASAVIVDGVVLVYWRARCTACLVFLQPALAQTTKKNGGQGPLIQGPRGMFSIVP